MTLALFFSDSLTEPLPAIGAPFRLDGPDGRHAAVVRRIGIGERVLIADGRGHGLTGLVVAVGKSDLTVEVVEHLSTAPRARRFLAIQALAKGDRSELAIEMLTELGVDGIIPWQASRSIVRWSGDRGEKSRQRWQSSVREAAKQSRQLRVPAVAEVHSTKEVVGALSGADCALVLHEEATTPLSAVELPEAGSVMVVIGPEGGISPEELDAFVAAGAVAVSLGPSVLRTSTAGVVALAGLLLR